MTNITTTLRDSYTFRNVGATGGAATLTGPALTGTLAATVDALRAGHTVTVTLLPREDEDDNRSWASFTNRDTGQWATLPGSSTHGGVTDIDTDGRARGVYVVFEPAAAAFLAPFVNAGSVDLIVTHDVLELHTPRVGARAIRQATHAA